MSEFRSESRPLHRFLVRTGAIAAKESLHIARDVRTLALAVLMPVLLLLLFGFGISFDLERIPVAIADADQSPSSRALTRAMFASGDFALAGRTDAAGAEEVLRRGEAVGVVVVPRGYQEALTRGEVAPIQLLVDGAEATTANQVLQKADAFARQHSRALLVQKVGARPPPLEVRSVTLYNPAARSAVFIVPGLVAYLLALGAVLLTALTVATEWERGSIEQLFASPVGRLEIVLGKLTPYLGLGFIQLLFVLVVGTTVFDVPVRGGLLLLFGLSLVFLLGMLAQGLLISVLAKSQMVATQAGALSAMLPSLLLSGMLFPIENMPWPLQAISSVIPARYMVHATRGVMLKGSGFDELWVDLVPMGLFALVVIAAATARFKRRIA